MKEIEYFFTKKIFITIILTVICILYGKAQITITGVVKDLNSKEPLIGATVLVKGTTSGTITDLDGKYILNTSNNATVLVFSFLGYISVERTITSNNINIELTNQVILKEIFVTDYSTANLNPNTCKLGFRVINDKITMYSDGTEKFEKAHWERDLGFQFLQKPEENQLKAALSNLHNPLSGALLKYNVKTCVNINYSLNENLLTQNLVKDKVNVLTFGKLLINNNSSLIFNNPSFSKIIIIADTIIIKNSCEIRLITDRSKSDGKESYKLSVLSIIARVVVFEGTGIVNYKVEVNKKQVNNLFFCAEKIIDNRLNKDTFYFRYLNFDSTKVISNNYFNEKKIGYYLGNSIKEIDKFYDGIENCINAWVINNLKKILTDIDVEAQDSWKRDILFNKYLYIKEYYCSIGDNQQDSLFNMYKSRIISVVERTKTLMRTLNIQMPSGFREIKIFTERNTENGNPVFKHYIMPTSLKIMPLNVNQKELLGTINYIKRGRDDKINLTFDVELRYGEDILQKINEYVSKWNILIEKELPSFVNIQEKQIFRLISGDNIGTKTAINNAVIRFDIDLQEHSKDIAEIFKRNSLVETIQFNAELSNLGKLSIDNRMPLVVDRKLLDSLDYQSPFKSFDIIEWSQQVEVFKLISNLSPNRKDEGFLKYLEVSVLITFEDGKTISKGGYRLSSFQTTGSSVEIPFLRSGIGNYSIKIKGKAYYEYGERTLRIVSISPNIEFVEITESSF